ncbi:MAG: S8 family serine peptidase [Cytophagaceae bacterium]|nr:S8 family serine peptidase [Cytophagaceae bacterium]
MASNRMKNILLFLILVIFFHLSSSAQTNKYFIHFTDKNNSPYSISNPIQYLSPRALSKRVKYNIPVTVQDLPVNPSYLDSLTSKGAQVVFASRWFNAALIDATASQLSAITALPFVQGSTKANRTTGIHKEVSHPAFGLQKTSVLSLDYGPSLNQVSMIGGDDMHNDGYNGEGVLIALLDAGFLNANTLSIFDSLFLNNSIIATYDFVDEETDVYDDDAHGMQVLSVMGAYESGSLIGLSWKAKYILLRTENDASETLTEEMNWLRGAEYADSAGADIINSSLGYNTFDDASMDHSYADMDGNTTIITRAADIAASKGILVVNSAGNEGNNSWKQILAPADGDSVLAVGAVTSLGNYASFSSRGPSYDGRIKPDVVAQGNSVVLASTAGGTFFGSGTSFSAPMISGLAAGIWQAFPYLTNMELLYYIQRSGSQYAHPDYKLGYGIPNYLRVKDLVGRNALDEFSFFPNPLENESLVVNLPRKEINRELKVNFYDITGRRLAEEIISSAGVRNELSTNIAGWARGVYIVHMVSSDAKYIIKIIKQ